MILRVHAKQNQVSPLWLAEVCHSPAALSFNVSYDTGYKAVSKSDLPSDTVGHLLHFAYILTFCAELHCPID